MPGAYTQLIYHVVFCTQDREPWLTGEVRDRLFPFIGGIVRNEGGSLWVAGGIEDHVHLCVRWHAKASVADLVRVVKANSSRWIRRTFAEHDRFRWQSGYAAFTVSRSGEPAVRRYIERQEEHHARLTYSEEIDRLLRAHGVEHPSPKGTSL